MTARRHWMLGLLAVGITAAGVCQSWAQPKVFTTPSEREYPNGSLLISPDFLTDQLEKVIVLDVRSEEAYKKGHAPTAIRIDHAEWKKAFGDGTDAKGWSQRIGDLGIDGTKPVVVYDDALCKNAARVWWILRFYQVPDVKLLNGCWNGYVNSKQPINREPAKVKPVTYKATANAKKIAQKNEVLEIISKFKGKWQVVDARSDDEFCGVDAHGAKKAGHIPGAKSVEWKKYLDQGSQRFKSAKELKKIFDDEGIDLSKPIVTHCHSGGRAAVAVFTMELMGAAEVVNYYSGWKDWGNDENTPKHKEETKKEK